MHAVAPVQPVPPHCPYSATAPAVLVAVAEVLVAVVLFTLLVVVPVVVVPVVVFTVLVVVPAVAVVLAPPGGEVVGTVDGWRAVFQVAVVGQAVAATVGEVVP